MLGESRAVLLLLLVEIWQNPSASVQLFNKAARPVN